MLYQYGNRHHKEPNKKQLMKDQSKGKTLTKFEKELVLEEAKKNRIRNKTKPKN